jgi:hypothetical protein
MIEPRCLSGEAAPARFQDDFVEIGKWFRSTPDHRWHPVAFHQLRESDRPMREHPRAIADDLRRFERLCWKQAELCVLEESRRAPYTVWPATSPGG